MILIISSPTKNTVHYNIEKVTLPSSSGQLQILPNYAETFMLLEKDKISFTNDKNKSAEIILSNKAQCYIKNNKITILI